ncbi:hypothetical protein GQX73_g2404 [Xylaria multiplex]|uniref:Urea transporter n=1 Tax=Xylaria multiplex TaxID=323545 RepID=A0A7C8MTL6_9PEZI|nr:hypothetical protein GQX73_g2404 [Xylaria multiplex]
MELTIAALGSGILFAYPQLTTIAGVQGFVTYTLSTALPLLIFGFVGPMVRRKCPEGFVLTEWTRHRYGVAAALYVSFVSVITLFLFMVSELSAVGQVVSALTGLDGLPVIIVHRVLATSTYIPSFYLAVGGFKISFLTDVIQGCMVLGLTFIAAIIIGVETHIDPSLIDSSGLLNSSLLGWQLLYILPVCILTNDFFLSSFWLRTFASKTDRELWIGVSTAAVLLICILTLVSSTGLIAAWSGAWPGNPPQDGSMAFFLLLQQMPSWVVGIVLVMVLTLSTSAFDSLQSAMVSTISNDLFRNRLNMWFVRLSVVLIIIPIIAIAIRAPSILQIYLISNLLSACTVPCLVIGLSDRCHWWGDFELITGSLGGVLTVFIFGCIFYEGDSLRAGRLLLVWDGLYGDDWSAFGAFVAAPVGSLLWGFGALGLRTSVKYMLAKNQVRHFDTLDHSPEDIVDDENTGPEHHTSQPVGKPL